MYTETVVERETRGAATAIARDFQAALGVAHNPTNLRSRRIGCHHQFVRDAVDCMQPADLLTKRSKCGSPEVDSRSSNPTIATLPSSQQCCLIQQVNHTIGSRVHGQHGDLHNAGSTSSLLLSRAEPMSAANRCGGTAEPTNISIVCT